jgi:hypothetical protein
MPQETRRSTDQTTEMPEAGINLYSANSMNTTYDQLRYAEVEQFPSKE